MRRKAATIVFTIAVMVVAGAMGQAADAYHQTNLVSDLSGVAQHTDSQLINPWGIAFFPGGPFWVADNNSGVSTLYDASGNKFGLVVKIPAPAGSTAPATPTGIVANPTNAFFVNGSPAFFIFDTEDGTISGWNGGTEAMLAVDNSKEGAVYKGLAMIQNDSGFFLLAANFHSGQVEIYDEAFNRVPFDAGAFSDPNIPVGYAPFGIHTIGQNVYVTYAKQNPSKHDPVIGPTRGFVDEYNNEGVLLRRFASRGVLDAPWGVRLAPATGFGAFSGALLIGNFGDGIINAFNPTTRALLGQIKNPDGTVIHNPGLWEMVFGAGGTGNPTTLYITAGILSEAHGLFATISR